MNQKVVVFSADSRFSEQLLTAIKSICYHNKNIKFYILNREFSSEWFQYLNEFLEKIGCIALDIKIQNEELKKYSTLEHISSDSTYFRYFISEFISEDKVLYLDCDLVVNGPLSLIFDIELNGYFIASTLDDIAQNIHNAKNNFNAGVMLINNKLWKEHDIHLKALEITEKYSDQIPDGDQGVLNILFRNKWFRLNHNANYMVGGEYIYRQKGLFNLILRKENELPLIIHFNSQYKPWLPIYDLPFRAYYWFYYKLSWEEIVARHQNNENQ